MFEPCKSIGNNNFALDSKWTSLLFYYFCEFSENNIISNGTWDLISLHRGIYHWDLFRISNYIYDVIDATSCFSVSKWCQISQLHKLEYLSMSDFGHDKCTCLSLQIKRKSLKLDSPIHKFTKFHSTTKLESS